MSRSSAYPIKEARPGMDPQIQELLRNVLHALDHAIEESQGAPNDTPPNDKQTPDTLQSFSSPVEDAAFKDFFKHHFKKETPPANLKMALLEKINQINPKP